MRTGLNVGRLALTIAVHLVTWAGVAYFAYAFARQPGPLNAAAWRFLSLIVLLALGLLVVGGRGTSGPWGLLDLIRWRRGRRAQERHESGCCIHCGYPIDRQAAAVCPECGQSPR
jgi:hypothetical protein